MSYLENYSRIDKNYNYVESFEIEQDDILKRIGRRACAKRKNEKQLVQKYRNSYFLEIDFLVVSDREE